MGRAGRRHRYFRRHKRVWTGTVEEGVREEGSKSQSESPWSGERKPNRRWVVRKDLFPSGCLCLGSFHLVGQVTVRRSGRGRGCVRIRSPEDFCSIDGRSSSLLSGFPDNSRFTSLVVSTGYIHYVTLASLPLPSSCSPVEVPPLP